MSYKTGLVATLAELEQFYKGQDTGDMIELMNQTNDCMNDVPWMESNRSDGHTTRVRTGLPDVHWRRLDNRTNHTSSDQSTTAPRSEEGERTHEQLLALLGELNDKLLPLPAPKPERVKRGQVECLAPFYDLRESMQKKMEAIFADAKELEREVKKAVRANPPCENEAAWEAVFKRSIDQLHDMVSAKPKEAEHE